METIKFNMEDFKNDEALLMSSIHKFCSKYNKVISGINFCFKDSAPYFVFCISAREIDLLEKQMQDNNDVKNDSINEFTYTWEIIKSDGEEVHGMIKDFMNKYHNIITNIHYLGLIGKTPSISIIIA